MLYDYLSLKNFLRKSKDESIIKFYNKFYKRFLYLNKKFNFAEDFDKKFIFSQLKNILKKKKKGKLHLIPIGLKDIINTQNLKTSFGLPGMKNFTPGNNARLVDDLIESDSLIFTKTTTAEFAVHFIDKKKNINPYHKDSIAGTSSTGSAIAVAIDALPITIGTQTGGSILRPASYCGIIGFKPTFGAIDRTGVLKTNDSLDTVGIFSKSIIAIEDTFNTLSRFNNDYPWTKNYLENLKKFKKRRSHKVGIFNKNFKLINNFDKRILDFTNQFLKKNSNLKIFEINNHLNLISKIHHHHDIIYRKSLHYYSDKSGLINKRISQELKNYLFYGKKISAKNYLKSLDFKSHCNKIFDNFFHDNYDFIIVPTTSSIAPRIREYEKNDTCLIWSFLGYPCITLPIKKKSINKMPFGLMIIANKYNDLSLLNFSKNIYKKLNV